MPNGTVSNFLKTGRCGYKFQGTRYWGCTMLLPLPLLVLEATEIGIPRTRRGKYLWGEDPG